MKSVGYLVVKLKMHKSPMISVFLFWHSFQLTWFLDHFLRNHLERPLISINDFEHIGLELIFVTDEGQIVLLIDDVLQLGGARVYGFVCEVLNWVVTNAIFNFLLLNDACLRAFVLIVIIILVWIEINFVENTLSLSVRYLIIFIELLNRLFLLLWLFALLFALLFIHYIIQ